jgi:hypothetical protein
VIPLAIDASTIIQGVVLFFFGSSFASILGYIFMRPKTRAEAAAKRAEGDKVDVASQTEIITNWATYSKELEERIEKLKERVDAADRREHKIAILIFQLTYWQQKAYLLLTAEQRAQVGEPPVVDPTLFDGLLSDLSPPPT